MKRDMELCRLILLEMEQNDRLDITDINDMELKGYTLDQIIYHCRLLYEHGFIKECVISCVLGKVVTFIVEGLSWEAHDFIASIREDTIWNKTKDVITQKGLPMAIDVVKEVSQAVITSMVQGTIKGLLQ